MMTNTGTRNKRETVWQEFCLFRERFSKAAEWEKNGEKASATIKWKKIIDVGGGGGGGVYRSCPF